MIVGCRVITGGLGFGGLPLLGLGFEGPPPLGLGFEGLPLLGLGFEGLPLLGLGFEGIPLLGLGFEGFPLPGVGLFPVGPVGSGPRVITGGEGPLGLGAAVEGGPGMIIVVDEPCVGSLDCCGGL